MIGPGPELTEHHEEQRTDQRGHDDQQREAEALPHRVGTGLSSHTVPGHTAGRDERHEPRLISDSQRPGG